MKRQYFILCLLIFFSISFNVLGQEKVFVIDKLEFKEVDRWYSGYIRRAFEKAEEENASLIILELDTPGGAVSDALNIKNILLDSEIPTVVFINKNAISAGALIALSAQNIYMADGSLIGAVTPVLMTGEGIKKADEKTVSAMRAAMRSAAEANGYNANIAEAMVDENIVLTKKDDGINLDNKTLLTLTSEEAIELGISSGAAKNISDILKLQDIKDAEIINIRENKYDTLTRFMLNPAFLSIILALGLFSLYLEIRTPGFAIPGAVAVICFGIYFIAQFSVGGFTWIAPAIFALGILLLLLEIFVIPGFGIAGIFGIISIIAGLLLAFDISNIETALTVVLSSVIVTTVLIVASLSFLPKSSVFKKIALADDTSTYHSSVSYEHILDRVCKTSTLLRPAGIIEIDGKRYDAISDGGFIDKDIEVKVILVQGNKIVVKKV